MRKLLLALLLVLAASKNLRFLQEVNQDLDKKLTTDETQKDQVKKANGIENITGAINQVCDSWSKIVTTFKTTHSKKIKELIPGKGFDKLNLKSELYVNIGLADSKYDAYFKARAATIGLKDAYLQKFKDTFEYAFWSENGVWSKCDLVFEEETQKNFYDSASVLVTESAKPDRHDILITYFQTEFKFADDILYIENSKSVLGGIFSSTKEEYVKKPKNLTDEEIEAVVAMYKMFSLKFIADVLGIKLKLPSLD